MNFPTDYFTNRIATSDETRFHIDLQLFYDKNGKPCIDAFGEVDADNNIVNNLRGKNLDELMEHLKNYLEDYYEVLKDIEE